MEFSCHLWLITIIMLSTDVCNAQMTGEKMLINHLLENYKRVGLVGRPVYNTSDNVNVNFGLAVIKLQKMNSLEETGTFSVWQRYSWRDQLLRWNPEDFEGIDHIRVPSKSIWRPDIRLYNSIGPEEPAYEDAMAVVSSDGAVMWIPPMTVKVWCYSDGSFPSETMECSLKYGSWTYDGFKLGLNFYDGLEDVDYIDYIQDNSWDLVHTSAIKNVKYYPCCAEPYLDLTFRMRFRRMWSYSSLSLVLPSVLSFLLMLLVFWLHPGSASKFVLAGVVFASFVFLMAYLTTCYRAAKFMAWLGLGMCLSFTTMFTSVITAAVAKKGDTGQQLPNCLHTVCVRVFGLILCSDRPNSGENNEDAKGSHGLDKDIVKQQWVAFAQVLDRMFFCVHVIILLIMAGANA